MKTYRRLFRRRLEAALQLRVRHSGPTPKADAPIEMPSEIVDVRTGMLAPAPQRAGQRTWRRPQEDQ